MSLLKWIQSSSNPTKPPASTGPSSSLAHPISTATTVAPDATASADGGAGSGIGPDLKRFGMENFGNTCYANSVLQALYFCQPFRDLLIAAHDTPAPPQPAIPSAPPNLQAPSSSATPSAALTKRTSLSRSGAAHKRNASSSLGDPLSSAAEPSSSSEAPTPPPIPSNPATLYLALRSLFFFIANQPSNKGVVAPQAFVAKLKKENVLFRSSMHQDAHEFLNYLLNKVVEDLEEEGKNDVLTKSISSMNTSTSASTVPSATSLSATPPPQPPPLIQSLFQGTLTNETRCLTCERVTSRSEPFLDLSLDISQNTSLNACLRHFSKSEMLTARNKFFCDECCGLVEAEKRMKIKTLPPILLLHLKRFKYQEDLQKYIKLSYRVAFPLELRLYNNTVDPTSADVGSGLPEGRGRRRGGTNNEHHGSRDTGAGIADEDVKGAGSGGPGDPEGLYKLFAVVVHIGGGPHHGHYVTLVKSPTTWLLFDDDSVEAIRESDIPKYFGDGAFTVEAAVNAAKDPAPTTPGTGITSGPGAGISGGGLVASAKVLSANAAPTKAQPTSSAPNPNSVITGTPSGMLGGPLSSAAAALPATLPPQNPMGSGYVLFYQATDIDNQSLGLITAAAKEATEVGVAMLTATTAANGGKDEVLVENAAVPPVPIPVVPAMARIYVEEPEEDDQARASGVGNSIGKNSTPSLASSSPASVTMQFRQPASPSTALTSSDSASTSTTGRGGESDSRARRQGLSLDIPPSLAPTPLGPEDQLSPLVLPSSVTATAASSGGGGFFKSLKHSASVKVERSSGGTGLGGFGLGLSGSTSFPTSKDHPNLGASAPILPANVNGDVPAPTTYLVPPLPPFPSKEKEKEKSGSNWFSTARKSVRRRSRNKEKDHKEKESEKEYTATGTASFSSTTSEVPLPLPPLALSVKQKVLPVDTNGFGGSVGGSGGMMVGGLIGFDGGGHGPGSAVGSVPPNRTVVSLWDERRASEPATSLDAATRTSAPARPSSIADDSAANPPPLRADQPDPAPAVPSEVSGIDFPPPGAVTPPFSRNQSRVGSPSPSFDRVRGLRVPSPQTVKPPSPPSAFSVPSSPVRAATTRNGRYSQHQVQKSLSLFDPTSPTITPTTATTTSSFSVGMSPIPRELHSKDGGGGLMKRASRKMSLNSSTIRLSGFGWHKDKDRDRG